MAESETRPEDSADPAETQPAGNAWGLEFEGHFWQNLRWFLARGVAVVGALALMGAVFTGFSGWYTSRPEFCRSCHIMEPYYVSWQESSHHDVSCIKCHFPPGVDEKVRGKLLGLVQLAKYVTSTQGPRPVAEVPDDSCLRSGCHETRLLAGRLDFDGIPFDHGPHLQEMPRGKQLRCTSCHSQIVQGSHMTVTTSTCVLCHFKDGHFNEGLGACTRCHQIPEQDFDLGGGAAFNHEVAYERGVNCQNCHQDLIRGNGEVPRERCGVCHNREEDFAKFSDFEFIHRKHVTDHKVDCMNCHTEIHHSYDPLLLQNAASDCASCHPGHHGEQVSMLEGVGARLIPSHPGSMTAHRISCGSCHQAKQMSATGSVIWKASNDACLICHDSQITGWLESYHGSLRDSLGEIQATIDRVRQAVSGARGEPEQKAAMESQLDDMGHDLEFLRVGNGIHNIHYATTLTQVMVDKLTVMCQELEIPEPEIVLPAGLEEDQASDVGDTESTPDTEPVTPQDASVTDEPMETPEPVSEPPETLQPDETVPEGSPPEPTEASATGSVSG